MRKTNEVNENKENVESERKKVSEVDGGAYDVVKVKKERKPRKRNVDDYGRLRKLSLSERNFLNRAVSEATKAKKSKLTYEERRKVLCVAREQIRSQRKANQIKSVRNKARYSAEFEWKKPKIFRR
ncbi:hypothetical protein NZF17_005214 [Salmonella enterica]|nr:hypothetical protein [Salmonella enterica]